MKDIIDSLTGLVATSGISITGIICLVAAFFVTGKVLKGILTFIAILAIIFLLYRFGVFDPLIQSVVDSATEAATTAIQNGVQQASSAVLGGLR